MCLRHNISPSNGILLRGYFNVSLINNPLVTRFLMNLFIHYNTDESKLTAIFFTSRKRNI